MKRAADLDDIPDACILNPALKNAVQSGVRHVKDYREFSHTPVGSQYKCFEFFLDGQNDQLLPLLS